MSSLQIKKGLSTNLDSVPIQDGQLLFTTDTKQIFLDNDLERLFIGSGSNYAYFEEDTTSLEGSALPIDADSLGGYPASSYSTTEQLDAQYVKASIEDVVMSDNGEVKPQSPLMLGENGILPLTSYDQIIMPDGTRWNGMSGGVYRAGTGIAISDDGVISLSLADGDEVSY